VRFDIAGPYELEAVLADVRELLEQRPADRTRTSAKVGEYPGACTTRGRIDGRVSQEAGISKSTLETTGCADVRSAEVEEMRELYQQAGGAPVVAPDEPAAELFPWDMCGMDVERGQELREFVVTAKLAQGDGQLSVRDTLRPFIEERLSPDEFDDETHPFISLEDARGDVYHVDVHNKHFSADLLDASDSPLAAHVGAEVLRVQHLGDVPSAVVRVRMLAELRANTLVYALRTMGFVDRNDLRGSMAWRHRIWNAARARELPEE
jgi:hypothetical protein